jgi:hypothetical protein
MACSPNIQIHHPSSSAWDRIPIIKIETGRTTGRKRGEAAMNNAFRRVQSQLSCGAQSWQHQYPFVRCWSLQTPLARRPLRATAPLAVRQSARMSSVRLDQTAPEAKAKKPDQKALDEQEQEVRALQSQVKRPWHRHGADNPPVDKSGEKAAPVTKGW